MATTDDYLNFITSAWRQKPNFTAMITADVSVQVQIQNLFEAILDSTFDLDLAIGSQLDIIGQWVGVSRQIPVPISGVFFTWDDTSTPFNTGWDYGIWQAESNDTSVTSLPDDVYRNLIKATIAANQWDGTTTSAYNIWSIVFPNLIILIQDHGDMSYDMAFYGQIVDALTLAIIKQDLPLRPEGVLINIFYVPVNTGPLFGWDMDTTYVKGWDTGSWAREISP